MRSTRAGFANRLLDSCALSRGRDVGSGLMDESARVELCYLFSRASPLQRSVCPHPRTRRCCPQRTQTSFAYVAAFQRRPRRLARRPLHRRFYRARTLWDGSLRCFRVLQRRLGLVAPTLAIRSAKPSKRSVACPKERGAPQFRTIANLCTRLPSERRHAIMREKSGRSSSAQTEAGPSRRRTSNTVLVFAVCLWALHLFVLFLFVNLPGLAHKESNWLTATPVSCVKIPLQSRRVLGRTRFHNSSTSWFRETLFSRKKNS